MSVVSCWPANKQLEKDHSTRWIFTQTVPTISQEIYIQKIRSVLDNNNNKFPDDDDRRDSIKAVLRYELDYGLHNDRSGGHFKENRSAAMGFLWLGLAISTNYQYDTHGRSHIC